MTDKCFMNGKIIISAVISKIIAKVLNVFFFENNLNKDMYVKHFVVPPLLAKRKKKFIISI